MSVSFIHPVLALAGAGAALLPIAIHLINRRRYRRQPWAAMGFLLAANRRSARRIQLEHALLLLLRCGILGLLGVAVARPFVAGGGFVPLSQSRVQRVLIVDNSASMQAVDEGAGPPVSRFERALAAAERLVSLFPPSDPVSIISAAEPAAAVIGYADFDRRRVRDRVRQLTVSDRVTDLAGALRAAADALGSSPAAPGSRVVYLFSDLQQSAWSATAVAASVRRLARECSAALVFVRVGPESAENAAVTAVSAAEPPTGGDLPLRISAEVANFGRTTLRGAQLQISRDDVITRSVPVDVVGPGERRTVSLSVAMGRPGAHAVQVRLMGAGRDALALDDVRYLSTEIAQSIPVLLVEPAIGGHAGGLSAPGAGQTGYLATALSPTPAPGEATRIVPRVVADTELSGEALAAFQVIVLCNVQRFDAAVWSRLESFVRAGGGLAIFAGELVNRENYNSAGYRNGEGVLPGALDDPVGGAASGASPGAFRRFLPKDLSHPLMADFVEAAGTGLFLARIQRYVPIKPDRTAAVALRYDNGAPAIVTRTIGQGRVCYVSTSANMEWTNLPAKGDFVALALDLIGYLAPSGHAQRNVLVGNPLVEALPPAAARLPLRVSGPAVTVVEARCVPAGDRFELRYEHADRAGVYAVTVADGRRLFAVNVDPRESALSAIAEPDLRRLIDAPATYMTDVELLAGAGGAGPGRTAAELGTVAIGALLVLLLIEMRLATRFGAVH